MQVDQQLIIHMRITEAVFYFDFFTLDGGEEVISHGNGLIAVNDHFFIFKADIGPGLDGEALVFFDHATDEVAQCFINVTTELVVGCQGRLEGYRSMVVRVQVINQFFCRFGVITTIGFDFTDFNNAFAPFFWASMILASEMPEA